MGHSDAQKRADKAYAAKLKRIPLDIKREEYDAIADAARGAGESVNAYIRGAIAQRMAGGSQAAPELVAEPERAPFEDAP